MNEEKRVINVTEVLELLHNGYTRTPDSAGYDAEIGSIQEYYGITDTEMMTAEAQLRTLFQHPKLKNKKTRKVKKYVLPFNIVDDTEETVDVETTTEGTTSAVTEEAHTPYAPTEVTYS